MKKEWHSIITDVREVTGLSQSALARIVGCTQPYISQLESGVRDNPPYSIGAALLELHNHHVLLGVPVRQS
jgi:transcriptional regulator with XRE-family HTH domain